MLIKRKASSDSSYTLDNIESVDSTDSVDFIDFLGEYKTLSRGSTNDNNKELKIRSFNKKMAMSNTNNFNEANKKEVISNRSKSLKDTTSHDADDYKDYDYDDLILEMIQQELDSLSQTNIDEDHKTSSKMNESNNNIISNDDKINNAGNKDDADRIVMDILKEFGYTDMTSGFAENLAKKKTIDDNNNNEAAVHTKESTKNLTPNLSQKLTSSLNNNNNKDTLKTNKKTSFVSTGLASPPNLTSSAKSITPTTTNPSELCLLPENFSLPQCEKPVSSNIGYYVAAAVLVTIVVVTGCLLGFVHMTRSKRPTSSGKRGWNNARRKCRRSDGSDDFYGDDDDDDDDIYDEENCCGWEKQRLWKKERSKGEDGVNQGNEETKEKPEIGYSGFGGYLDEYDTLDTGIGNFGTASVVCNRMNIPSLGGTPLGYHANNDDNDNDNRDEKRVGENRVKLGMKHGNRLMKHPETDSKWKTGRMMRLFKGQSSAILNDYYDDEKSSLLSDDDDGESLISYDEVEGGIRICGADTNGIRRSSLSSGPAVPRPTVVVRLVNVPAVARSEDVGKAVESECGAKVGGLPRDGQFVMSMLDYLERSIVERNGRSLKSSKSMKSKRSSKSVLSTRSGKIGKSSKSVDSGKSSTTFKTSSGVARVLRKVFMQTGGDANNDGDDQSQYSFESQAAESSPTSNEYTSNGYYGDSDDSDDDACSTVSTGSGLSSELTWAVGVWGGGLSGSSAYGTSIKSAKKPTGQDNTEELVYQESVPASLVLADEESTNINEVGQARRMASVTSCKTSLSNADTFGTSNTNRSNRSNRSITSKTNAASSPGTPMYLTAVGESFYFGPESSSVVPTGPIYKKPDPSSNS